MWYTHYFWDVNDRKVWVDEETMEGFIDALNESYREFLQVIIDPDSKLNLLEIYNTASNLERFPEDSTLTKEEADKIEAIHERCFHEYSWDDEDKITLVGKDNSFCKTARKIYDLAVILTLQIAWDLWQWNFSSDSQNARIDIQEYASTELDDKYNYDFTLLDKIYNERLDFMQAKFNMTPLANETIEDIIIEDDDDDREEGDIDIHELTEEELAYIINQIMDAGDLTYTEKIVIRLDDGRVVNVTIADYKVIKITLNS